MMQVATFFAALRLDCRLARTTFHDAHFVSLSQPSQALAPSHSHIHAAPQIYGEALRFFGSLFPEINCISPDFAAYYSGNLLYN